MYKIIKEIQDGNKALLNDLLDDSMDFINSYVEPYKNVYEDYDDLLQEAILVFINSIYFYKYNPKFNKYFYSQYAGHWINLRLLTFVLKNLNRVFDDDDKLIISLNAYDRVKKNLNYEPSIKEFSEYYNLKYHQAELIINFINGSDFNEDIYMGLKEFCDDYSLEDETVKELETELFIKRYLSKTLKDNQINVILHKYGFGKEILGYTEIAKLEGVSKQCVNSRHDFAIKKLIKMHYEDLEKYYKE